MIVAVIDDGIEATHEDLFSGKFFGGWDFAGAHPKLGVQDSDPAPGANSRAAHGMAVSGIISADADNQVGVSGIAPSCKLMRLKIFGDQGQPWGTHPFDSINPPLNSLPSLVAQAISHAAENGADIVNGSWGWLGYTWPIVREAIIEAADSGVVFIFSSGNDYINSVKFPASLAEYYEHVLSVGAVNRAGEHWSYSNTGVVSLCSPSGGTSLQTGDVYTLDIGGVDGYNPEYLSCDSTTGEYICYFGGTSAAAPQVAGVAALVLSRTPQWFLNDTGVNFGRHFLGGILKHSAVDQTGRPSEDTPGYDQYHGYGLVNALRALLTVARGDANNSGAVESSDIPFVVDALFRAGPYPEPHVLMGDANCDGQFNISDLTYLNDYIYRGGPPPNIPCFEF